MKTFSVIGLGARGNHYANLSKKYGRLTAVCDTNPMKLAYAKKRFSLADTALFSSEEEFFAKGKLSDYLYICNQDRQHAASAIRGLNAGYDILLEKPIACTLEDCLAIEETAKRLNRKVVICHVLRYTGFYTALKKLIDSGAVGRIISIEQSENVGFWHQAHSFVRGNWRNEGLSAPMILAKCCHDLDILGWLAGSRCESLNSVGALNYFKPENAPEGATKTCLGGCPHLNTCPYSAKRIYLDPNKLKRGKNLGWPHSIVLMKPEGSYVDLEQALREGPYGRCVFFSDNDVVDHQVVQMRFNNGVNASLTMSAFSREIERRIVVRGTHGEIRGRMESGKITFRPFAGKKKTIRTKTGGGHGGGDQGLIKALFEGETTSLISDSVISHAMAFAAEESRKKSGAEVKIDEFIKKGTR